MARKKKTNNKKQSKAKPQKRKSGVSNLISVLIKNHKDKNGGHPHVIVDNIDNKHVSVGLTTHKRKGNSEKAGKNYSLKNNPLDNNAEPTFMRRQATIDDKSQYYSPRTGKMDKVDYEQAKEYGKKARDKYLNKKEQKK